MKSFLHDPAMRQRLRKWRPLYNAVFRRQKDLSGLPQPSEQIRTMYGRGLFLFSFGRCGTTVFSDFLASHPEVVTFGEVLNEDSYYSFYQDFSRRSLRWWSFRPGLMRLEFYDFLARLVGRTPECRCLFDLKIEGLHLIEGNWRLPGLEFEIFEALQDSNAPVILVERRDLVARHVSGQIATRRGAFHSYHAEAGKQIAPFRIDIARMEAANALIRAQIAHIKARFADHPRFETVVYEDMFAPDPASGEAWFRPELAARMAALLDVEDRFERRPQLARVSGGKERDPVLNRDEVETARQRQPGMAEGAAA